jgi:hexokinase
MRNTAMLLSHSFRLKGFNRSVALSLGWQCAKGQKSNFFSITFFAHKYSEDTTRIAQQGKAINKYFEFYDFSRLGIRRAILGDIKNITFISESYARELLPDVKKEVMMLDFAYYSDRARDEQKERILATA